MEKSKLLALLDDRWNAFQEAWRGLTPQELAVEKAVGEWSVRDIIAHVAIWEEENLKNLPLIVEEKPLKRYSTLYGGIDAFNALKADEKRKLSLEDVLAYSQTTHAALKDMLASFPAEAYKTNARFVRRVRADTVDHYPEHAQSILAWRQGRKEG